MDDELKDDFTLIENFLTQNEASELFTKLTKADFWEQREIIIFNKKYMQPRLIKWFSDFDYKYSNQVFKKDSLPDFLINLKKRVDEISNLTFNSVLLNYYRDGEDSMGKHQDNEKELGVNPIIASLSLGETRTFKVQNKISKKNYNIKLKNGDLLIMKNQSQKLFYHSLPKNKNVLNPRINLTFRKIY